MKLFELDAGLDNDAPLRVATAAALARVKSDIEDSAYKGEFKVKSLLKILHDYDVDIDHAQLIELSKEEPWSNLIANIKGDHVIFKGDPDESSNAMKPDETTDTLEKMAGRAGKKQEKGL